MDINATLTFTCSGRGGHVWWVVVRQRRRPEKDFFDLSGSPWLGSPSSGGKEIPGELDVGWESCNHPIGELGYWLAGFSAWREVLGELDIL